MDTAPLTDLVAPLNLGLQVPGIKSGLASMKPDFIKPRHASPPTWSTKILLHLPCCNNRFLLRSVIRTKRSPSPRYFLKNKFIIHAPRKIKINRVNTVKK